MDQITATLELEDGLQLQGISFGAPLSLSGECVFQTGMVGYVESLTDPSYRGQILVLSYPLIGNYGVPPSDTAKFGTDHEDSSLPVFMESRQIQVAGLVVADYSGEGTFSHWNATSSLGSWLRSQNVPAIHGIDTRALIKHIRKRGSMPAKILIAGDQKAPSIVFEDPNSRNLVAEVSTTKVLEFAPTHGSNHKKVLMVDCGMKSNQVRCFLNRGIHVTVVPWNHAIHEVPRDSYDGLFLSNGPGNPAMLSQTVDNLSAILMREAKESDPKPIFGICLGNQLLARAAGADTYKLKFGNRGQNQPCVDLISGRCHLTMQNHGYAIATNTLPSDWIPYFENANDKTNEGIKHVKFPWFSVQFHPEAKGGPTETEYLFDKFVAYMKHESFDHPLDKPFSPAPTKPVVSKVILLGSGGLSIGQAGEFDYSGSQAIKALKEENVKTILINPNIATVQTSSGLADKVYFLPVTPAYVTKIIEQERPDGILLQFGGQTALNCGMELWNSGVLAQFGVAVLGTSVETIIATEDRALFSDKLKEINEKIAPSIAAVDLNEALSAARKIGYPVIIRAGFALGGLGSGFASNDDELTKLAVSAFANCPQILVEKSLKGWKEIEYEVVRDSFDNCITVCNMENFDPLGIHTGESIVVAPSQTLSDTDYHLLRRVALTVVRHLKVIGECNIQFAFDPHSECYYIIEVNARLSRSSALASKATGYPLAFIAAKLALGHSLPSLRNTVTKSTTACWEPSLDYVVVKMPRWDLNKFSKVSRSISTSMKSVGEVMAIGRVFEEAIQKAIRMVHPSKASGFHSGIINKIQDLKKKPVDESTPKSTPSQSQDLKNQQIKPMIEEELVNVSDERIFFIAEAFESSYTVEEIHQLTKIDKWFLSRLEKIFECEKQLKQVVIESNSNGISSFDRSLMMKAKRLGFSDKQIARASNSTEAAIRSIRKELNIFPFVKQIDTVAAEFPVAANINYTYMTYNATEDDCPPGFFASDQGNTENGDKETNGISNLEPSSMVDGPSSTSPNQETISSDDNNNGSKSIIVLGSGSYSIGSSVEFDWCAVSCIRTASKLGYKTIMINYNPETVSTDYDECDKLYFEELSVERVLDIFEREKPLGVVVSMGGQIPNNIAMQLSRNGVSILGSSAEMIESAENRYKFSRLLDSIGVDQPMWKECRSMDETLEFCRKVQFPCLVRPSFVLSGAGMNVVYSERELQSFLEDAQSLNQSRECPVVISKFISNAKEIDVDAIAQNGTIIAYAVSEHVENAGVHSGDATLLLPAQDLAPATLSKLNVATKLIARNLNVSGPFNVQFIAKDDEIKVIECNLRASRSLPFVSKTLLVDFAELASKALLGVHLDPIHIDLNSIRYVGTKVPQFSFTRLQGADPILGVEMASTGEVACFGSNKYEAYAKALIATGYKWPKKKRVLLSIGPFAEKLEFLPSVKKLVENGFCLFGTPGTSDFLSEHGIKIETLQWEDETSKHQDDNSVEKAMSTGNIDLFINFPSTNRLRRPSSFISNGYQSRRIAVDFSIPLVTNIKIAKLLVEALILLQPSPATLEGIKLKDLDCRSSHSKSIIRLPGMYDVHVHMREPGGEHKEDWESGTCAALAGGITFVAAMPNTQPSIIDQSSFDLVSNIAKQKARCDYGIFLGASQENAQQVSQIAQHQNSNVFALKMYLDQTFSTLKLDNLSSWMDHFENFPKDHVMCLHSEGKSASACILLAHLYDRPVHICHVSLKEEIELIKKAKEKGIRVTCEVCPHHLFLTRDDIPKIQAKFANGSNSGGFHEVRPRLNTTEDQKALWDNMAVIDVIATDHAPHTVEEKSKSENAPPGFPGLETVLPLMLNAVNQGRLTMDQLIEKMHTNPKRIFNLPDQTDTWIEVDLDAEWTIPTSLPYTKSKWTPFAGFKVKGKVERVILRGQVVMSDGKVLAPPGYGLNAASMRSQKSFVTSLRQHNLPPSSYQYQPTNEVISVPSKNLSSKFASASSPSGLSSSGNIPNNAHVNNLQALSPSLEELVQSHISQKPIHNLSSSPSSPASIFSSSLHHHHHQQHISHFQRGSSVLSVHQFSRADLHKIFSVASDMKAVATRVGSVDFLKGKLMANVFYEPSTRTSSSFFASMTRLGGNVLEISTSTSSIAKGESLEDTIKTLSTYCDLIVLRHPEIGAVQRAAKAALNGIPIINAGDGIGEHPTQALLDVFTVREELGTVNGLHFTIVGDLKHGRTVHSLVQLLALYSNISITYVSPLSLSMPQEIVNLVSSTNSTITQSNAMQLDDEILKQTDVLYVTRIQKERFSNPEDYEIVKGSYKITPHTLTHAKDSVIVMHPLPRIDEIDTSLDSDPRAAYFRQAANGMYVRMALLSIILNDKVVDK